MHNEYAFLASEKTTLETLQAELPVAHVIDRWSLLARLEDVREGCGNGVSTQDPAVQ